MKLLPIDWAIILFTMLICFIPTLFFGNRPGKSTFDFPVSRRSITIWLAGRSIIATTSRSDTPNRVTQRVRQYCVSAQSRQELA
jgi:SSS family solute:Na+ symporter